MNNADPTGQNVYSCTRPLMGVPRIVYDYLGIGHRYLWVDKMKSDPVDENHGGWGLMPKQGYEYLAVITPVPGWIKPDDSQILCTFVTDDPCREQRIKDIIEAERVTWHIYSLKFHNCYYWANHVLGESL